MIESLIFKILLILYVLISFFIVFLLIKNPSAPSSLANVGILFASILPVLIAVLPYINTQTIKEDFNYTIFYDSVDKKIIFGKDFGPYSSSYSNIFANLSDKDLTYDNLDALFNQKGIDLIEKGIIVSLFLNFSNTWDKTFVRHDAPQVKVTESINNNKVPKKVFKSDEIVELFNKNQFINKYTIIWPDISLPPDSQLRVERSDNLQKVESIIIATPKSDIVIMISPAFASVCQHSVSGLFDIDKVNINRYYSLNYRVSFSMRYKGFERYSNLMESYNHFQVSLIQILRNMDWSNVEMEIQQNLFKKANEKIISL